MEEDKKIEYLQKSLRGGNEIYKKGGHVVMKYKERNFSLKYDNRRKVLDPQEGEHFLDTVPLNSIEDGAELRKLSKIFSQTAYNRNSSKSLRKSCKTVLETGIRSFLKDLLSEEPMYGLDEYKHTFKDYNDIIKFIKEFGYSSISKSSLSMIKKRKTVRKSVERTPETERFVDYVKNRMPNFRDDLFFK